jgi:hypothetical protein
MDDKDRTAIPFLIRGTFAQPKFSLDAKRLMERNVPRPAESVRDILERLRKKIQPPE